MEKRNKTKVAVKNSSCYQYLKSQTHERKTEIIVILFYAGYIAIVGYCFIMGIELPDITGFE